MLTLNNISFSYQKNRFILKNISTNIDDTKITAIAGRNGSGKTTLTRLLMGLVHPNRGSMTLDDVDITKKEPYEMAQYIGYVFQNPDQQLFASTVFEEVAFAPRKLGCNEHTIKKRVEEVLKITNLQDVIWEMPQVLTLGQKQRLSIACALAAKPKILILDEPTSGQDCRERTMLLRLMRKLNAQGLGIIMVTHDMDILAEHADKVIVINQGELAFDGTPLDLFSQKELTLKLGLELPEAVCISQELRSFTQTRLIIMYKLTALTKLILAIMISIASLITNDLYILSILALIEIFTCFYLPKTKLLWSALGILIFFSFILFLIQLVCGTDLNTSIASALKMFIMAVSLLLLLQTTSARELTASLVKQLHLPYQYAFMITAILRFVPDILEESSAVRDAQNCRGFKPSSNPFRRIFDYMMVIKPMVFRSISRSENMALSLQMRGFSSPKPRVFIIDTKLRAIDYISMILFLIILSLLFYFI